MEGKDAIISSILNNAEKTATKLVAKAEEEKLDAISSLKTSLESKLNLEIEKAKQDAELYKARRLSSDEMEKSKTILAAKQRLIDKVFDDAITKILNMTDNYYREFIQQIIAKYAENGDTVIVAEKDIKRINQEFIDSAAKKLNIRLNLSSDCHNKRGGVILVSKNYDKNLTLEALVKTAKTELEGKVAKKLFA